MEDVNNENSKLQASSSRESTSAKPQGGFWNLKFGVSLKLEDWCLKLVALELGAFA